MTTSTIFNISKSNLKVDPLEEDSVDEEEKQKVKNNIIHIDKCLFYSWGKNKYGELGNGSTCELVKIPTAVTSSIKINISNNSFQDLSIAGRHCLILNNNQIYACGSDLLGLSGSDNCKWGYSSSFRKIVFFDDKNICSIASAEFHNLALTSDGLIYAWGGNLHNKLGSISSLNGNPILVRSLMKKKVIEIAVGDYHSVALTNHGSVYSWGGGGTSYNRGQCGHGDLIDREIPTKISFFNNVYVTSISCGGYHTIATTNDLINTNNLSSTLINSKSKSKLISTSNDSSLRKQFIYGFGNGEFGQCGYGLCEDTSTPKIINIYAFSNWIKTNMNHTILEKAQTQPFIIKIKCGGYHTVFLSENGLVYTFGHGFTGQLGLGNTYNYQIPILVNSLSNKFIVDIAAGWSHTLALTKDGHCYITGCGKFGTLGLNTLENKKSFTLIEELKYFNIRKNKGIFSGGHHSYIVLDSNNPSISQKEYSPPSPLKENTCKFLLHEKSKPELLKFNKSFNESKEGNRSLSQLVKRKDSKSLFIPISNVKFKRNNSLKDKKPTNEDEEHDYNFDLKDTKNSIEQVKNVEEVKLDIITLYKGNISYTIGCEIIYANVELIHRFVRFKIKVNYDSNLNDLFHQYYNEKAIICKLKLDTTVGSQINSYTLCLISTNQEYEESLTTNNTYNNTTPKYKKIILTENQIEFSQIEIRLSKWRQDFLANFSFLLLSQPKFLELRPFSFMND